MSSIELVATKTYKTNPTFVVRENKNFCNKQNSHSKPIFVVLKNEKVKNNGCK
jgi:hypothetical protein